jgi:soluble lytic murein transglycosylase-like protein
MNACSASVTKSKHAKRRALLAVLASLPFANARTAESRPDSKLVERIAGRYRVAPSAVERVIALVERHFPTAPTLLLAIVGVESSWRPWSVGRVGEVGLCQVRPDLHGATATELADPAVNIRVAAGVLRRCLKRSQGNVAGAVARYNGKGEAAEDYATRVLAERDRLLALDDGLRPDLWGV